MRRDRKPISKRLAQLLLVCFALNALGFLAAAVILETSQRGIGANAELLIDNSTPSMAYISTVRTEAWRLQMLSSRAVRTGAVPPSAEFVQAQERLRTAWDRYVSLIPLRDEPPLQARMRAALGDMQRALATVIERLDAGDLDGAGVQLDQRLQPAVSALDGELSRGIEFHRATGRALAQDIADTRRQGALDAIWLMAAALVFGAAAVGAAVAIVRQSARLLEAQVDELGQFAGRVAHDIRNPLTSIGLVLHAASSRMSDDAAVRPLLQRGTASAQRIEDMLGGLMSFAQAGAQPEPGARCELAPTVDAAIDELRPLAAARGIELRVEPLPRVEVAASAGVVMSLLSNLVGNALKYMDDAPVRTVTAKVRLRDHRARVEVIDTGPGIPPDWLRRIFEPYVRGERRTEQGHGLGLATVRRLAEAHGGAAGAASRVGEGATVWFELPMPARPSRFRAAVGRLRRPIPAS